MTIKEKVIAAKDELQKMNTSELYLWAQENVMRANRGSNWSTFKKCLISECALDYDLMSKTKVVEVKKI
jgi:hypothetical protein